MFKSIESIIKITAIFLIIAAVSWVLGFPHLEVLVTRCLRDGEVLIGCGPLRINKLFWPYFWFHKNKLPRPHYRKDTFFTHYTHVAEMPGFEDYEFWLTLLFSAIYWLFLSILIYKLTNIVSHKLKRKQMDFLKKLPRLFYLLFLLILALLVDLLLFATTTTCAGCSSFGQFLTSPSSLTGPVLVALISLFPCLTKILKCLYNRNQ